MLTFRSFTGVSEAGRRGCFPIETATIDQVGRKVLWKHRIARIFVGRFYTLRQAAN